MKKQIKISTFGSSHSKLIGAKVYNLPKGFLLDCDKVNYEAKKRSKCYGRSVRQVEEKDEIFFTSGLDKAGRTNGRSLVFHAYNSDSESKKTPITALRSGHVDYAGCAKYGLKDARPIVEYANGRSTLPHTIAGAVCRQIMQKTGVTVTGFCRSVGGVTLTDGAKIDFDFDKDDPTLLCPDIDTDNKMRQAIDEARNQMDSLGGIAEVIIDGLPVGVGDFRDYYGKIDSLLSAYLMAIPSVKGIEFGNGFGACSLLGSQNADILREKEGNIYYATNNCGGVTGGLTCGAPIIIRLAVKPVPTIAKSLDTVDIVTLRTTRTHYERSDTCVVKAVAVAAADMCMTVLLSLFCEEGRL